MSFIIKEISAELIPDYLKFFDDIAFCDNPGWSKCYCCHYFLRVESEFDTRDYAQKMISEGIMKGFIAYDKGLPVGWCNCSPIGNYPMIIEKPYDLAWRIDEETPYPIKDMEKTVALVCFVIDPERRRQGIATQLIEHAIKHYKHLGYKWMDVSARKSPKTLSDNYHGPKGLYEKHDFEVIGENDLFQMMRKTL